MTPIPTEYTNPHGFTLKLIARKGMVAIYEEYLGRRFLGYEVVRIRVDKGRAARVSANGRAIPAIPAYERLPTEHDWGRYGKTVSALSGVRAEAKSRAEWWFERCLTHGCFKEEGT